MIHVNARGLLIREVENERQLIIQLRKREGEPEVYELPGGRINSFISYSPMWADPPLCPPSVQP